MSTEAPIAQGTVQGGPKARALAVTTVIDGVVTTVRMPVISIAKQDGTLIDLDLAARLDVLIALLGDLRRESMIQNELLVRGLNLSVDLDLEYRTDPAFAPFNL